MSKTTSSKPWWSQLGFGPREAVPDTDYADMGTAFGLDASMKPVAGEPEEPLSDGDGADGGTGARPR